MKYCHSCEKRYADEQLVFCLDDGTSLYERPKPRAAAAPLPVVINPKQSTIDTIAFSNPATVEKAPQTEPMLVNFDKHWDKTQYEKKPVVNKKAAQPVINKRPAQKKVGKSGASFIWPALLLSLLVLCGAGIGGWFYFSAPAESAAARPSSSDEAKDTLPANTAMPSGQSSLSKSLPSPSPVIVSDSGDPKKEVADDINSWKDLAESRNVDAYVGKYANTVDYYDKNQVNVTDVRKEVQKIFGAYNDIDVILSNVRIAVDTDGHKATASFDKEWTYEADKNLAHGKDHIRMQLQKDGSDWKIFSEKIRKNYYTRS